MKLVSNIQVQRYMILENSICRTYDDENDDKDLGREKIHQNEKQYVVLETEKVNQ